MEVWGSTSWKVDRDALLLEWFGGDREAFQFMMTISDITELWDDLIDQDKLITVERLDAAMIGALVSLPCNPFYTKHRTYLTPLIIQAINSWQCANVLEQGSKNDRAVAYTLRNMDIQIVQAIIYLTQGHAKMKELSPMIWKMFAAEQDDFITWVDGDAA